MLLNPILAAEALGLDTSTPEWQAVRDAADVLLVAGPCADAIECAVRTRAVERYPLYGARHVLAGLLVLELATTSGFRGDYAIAREVMDYYLGASTTRDPEGSCNGSAATTVETVEQARAAIDLAIRLICDERPLAEIVCDAAATVLHDSQGNRREQRDRANRDAARARRMLRVIVRKPLDR